MNKNFALILFFSAALAACQSGAAMKKLNVELKDFTFTPNQFTVQAGAEITISVTNNGSVEHDFNIMKSGADIGDTFEDEDHANVLWETDVRPGETKSPSQFPTKSALIRLSVPCQAMCRLAW